MVKFIVRVHDCMGQSSLITIPYGGDLLPSQNDLYGTLMEKTINRFTPI